MLYYQRNLNWHRRIKFITRYYASIYETWTNHKPHSKMNDIDNFLVDNKINLDDFSTARLLEACSDRLIGGPGQTDEEMRNYLANWLDLTTYKPTERIEKTGEYFNTNLAKTAMMGYYSVSGARDDRSASYLPRLMFSARPEID